MQLDKKSTINLPLNSGRSNFAFQEKISHLNELSVDYLTQSIRKMHNETSNGEMHKEE